MLNYSDILKRMRWVDPISTTLENIAASLEKESKIEQGKVKNQYDAQLKLVNNLIALEKNFSGKDKFSEEELKKI